MSPTASIHDRAMGDLQKIFQAMNLAVPSGFPGNPVVGNIGQNVFVQEFPEETNLIYPCLLLTCDEEQEDDDADNDTTMGDAVIYPIRVLICDRVSARYRLARPVYQAWRFALAQTLRGLTTATAPILPDTPECWAIRVKTLKIFDPKPPQYQFVVSGLIAQVRTVTPRWRGGQQP